MHMSDSGQETCIISQHFMRPILILTPSNLEIDLPKPHCSRNKKMNYLSQQPMQFVVTQLDKKIHKFPFQNLVTLYLIRAQFLGWGQIKSLRCHI